MAEPLKVVYEDQASLDALKGKTVAVIGYGSQGHAHAQNLRDSGVKVIVANRRESANGKLAIEHGFDPVGVDDAVKAADHVIITLPDEVQPEVYNKSIKPNLKAGKSLGATHGFNFHFKTIEAPKDVDIILIAPKGPCGIRPTVTGPARISVLQASSVIAFSVMTVCNLPMWEYSGDSPGTRGHKRPYRRTVDTRIPINTPVQCP